MPTPGARERAILRQGTQPGTPVGEAVRFVAQFKAFPVTMLSRVLGRTAGADTTRQFFQNMTNGKGDVMGIVHMIVALTAMGYVSQSAKQIARGKTPRDPTDAGTWVAAMLQGGGLGLYGDFLFGQHNRFGRSAVESAAGPVISEAGSIIALLNAVREGEDPSARALNFAISNTPFAGLFYTRVALDYLILFQMQEAVSPGFLRRMERRIERENQQSFILPPSQAVPNGGGARLFEGVKG